MQHQDRNQVSLTRFPPPLEYKALWAPIYWEPIVLSGEKLTSIIAAIGLDGQISVITCIRRDVLQALYPANYSEALSLIGWAASSLEKHLINGGNISEWEPPVSGFNVGNLCEVYSTCIEKVAHQVVPLCSSLSQIEFQENSEINVSKEFSLEILRASIKNDVVMALPRLKDNFSKPFNVVNGARQSNIDFVGSRMAANFSKLSIRNLARYVKDSKSQILDLATYKDRQDLFKSGEVYKLMVWLPNSGPFAERESKLIQEAYLELENEGQHFGLSVSSYSETQRAAQDILKIEIAA